jgi:hypothetical protein
MLRIRLLILLSACCVISSAAWADTLGFVDCSSHPEETQVFSKPRQSSSVAVIPCGERFTVLLNGFIFSRVETKDGKVGYVFTNVISVAADGEAPLPSRSPQVAGASTTAAPVEPARPAAAAAAVAPAPAQPAPPSPVPPSAANTSNAPANPASVDPSGAPPSGSGNSQVATVAPTSATVTPPPSAVADTAVTASASEEPGPLSLTPPPAANTSSAPAPAPEPVPARAEASQPQPEAAPSQPAPIQPPPIRDAGVQSSWERPLPSARQNSRLEFYSGYSYVSNNLNGVMASFGYNIKSWLQIAGDSSYDIVTMGGVKNILYANHYGGRYYYRHLRWGFTPFLEGLVGGSRLNTSGDGVKTSTNCLSYKAGGGIDVRVSRHWEIRAINADYYHSSFGTNAAQSNNNYWVSAGVVLRLFGSTAGD